MLATAAVVAKRDARTDLQHYLLLMPEGRPSWTDDSQRATAFASMREATRMAARLPAGERAYGLPMEASPASRVVH